MDEIYDRNNERCSKVTAITTITEDREFASKIDMCISHTDFKDLRTHTNTFKNAIISLLLKRNYVAGLSLIMSKEEFDRQTNTLYKCCLKIVGDRHELHKRRVMGLTILNDIILRADPVHITMDHVIHLVWSTMSCLHHFQLRLRSGSRGLVYYARKRTVAKCLKSYTKLINIFPRNMHRVVLNSILTFYQEGKLWLIEFACRDLIVGLLNIYWNAGEAMFDILDMIERVARKDVMVAKYVVQVLHQTLSKVKWHTMSHRLVVRFISMLERSIINNEMDRVDYGPLRNGILLCVRNSIKNMKNNSLILTVRIIIMRLNTKYPSGLPSEIVICLANLAAYAANLYSMKSYYKVLSSAFMDQLITFVHNENHKYVLGFRVWRNLLDRNKNWPIFVNPRIFFRSGRYKIKISHLRSADKLYLKSCVHVVLRTTVHGFVTANSKRDLELIYQAIAVTLVEIPCGYSAATYVTILMEIQEYAMQISEDNFLKSHHLHAIIMALMTLICYIHKADVLYDYVLDVMHRRSRYAPHLNPPLKTDYNYSQHDILWNKRDLFFEDWEVRYGLWRCFKKRRPNQ